MHNKATSRELMAFASYWKQTLSRIDEEISKDFFLFKFKNFFKKNFDK